MRAICDEMWLGVRAVARMVRHPRAQALALAVGLYIAIGVVFYSWQEGWSVADSFYFTMVSLTTVGLGDLAPTTTLARLFTAAYLAVGLGILATAVHSVIQSAAGRLAQPDHKASDSDSDSDSD